MKQLLTFTLLLFGLQSHAQQWLSSFESIDLQSTDTFWNGSDLTGGVLNNKAFFKNSYDTTYKSWSGFSISSRVDVSTPGFVNQYSAFTGSGVNFTGQYAVLNNNGTIVLTSPQKLNGTYVTNATYTALSMRDGDNFAKKFGGTDGNDADYFGVVATGYGAAVKSDTFYLADYRFTDNSMDYIVSNWEYFDLSGLGVVDSIGLHFISSDTGQWGINTPQYACFDNFNASLIQPKGLEHASFENANVLQDSFNNGELAEGGFYLDNSYFVNNYNQSWKSWSGWALSTMTDTMTRGFSNQYSAITQAGAGGSETYIVGYNEAHILLPYDSARYDYLLHRYAGAYITNSTYAYHTMKEGGQFNKKFGGDDGNDPDYLRLNVSGVDFFGKTLDTVAFYLADYRFDDNSKDYILNTWDSINLSSIIENRSAVRLDFWLEGSDTGQYGLNTPAYFCMDDLFKTMTNNVKQYSSTTVVVYPNPASDFIHVDADKAVSSISLYDLNGRFVSTKLRGQAVDLTEVVEGIYIMQVQFEDKTIYTHKIVVE